jgi:hypothetical protein
VGFVFIMTGVLRLDIAVQTAFVLTTSQCSSNFRGLMSGLVVLWI